jgi:hypothetical protein
MTLVQFLRLTMYPFKEHDLIALLAITVKLKSIFRLFPSRLQNFGGLHHRHHIVFLINVLRRFPES